MHRRNIIYGILVITVVIVFAVLTNILSQGDSTCQRGTYACANSTICLHRSFWCDGHKDCPEGDDESKIRCIDTHGSDYLGNLTNKNYNVSEFENCVLDNVPLGCNCTHHTWLTCKHLTLKDVPQEVSINVIRMIFDNNSMELTNNSLKRYKLELLQIVHNEIGVLPEELFTGQDQLTRLLLSFNKLTSIPSGALRDLKELEWLMIVNNNLSYLDLDDLQYTNISWIELYNNRLTFKGQVFPELPNLKQLSAENNSIEVVEEFTFSNLVALKNLDLHGNRIRYVHRNAFRRLRHLERLDLSKNQIKTLYPTIFHDNPVLAQLNLGYNPLQEIPENLFRVKTLLSLNLLDVEIDNINMKMFSYLDRLEFVYFKKFLYCSYTPGAKSCKPNTDGVSSNKDLLVKPILRVTVWVVAALTCVGNGMVLWGRFSFRDENRVLSLVIRNLADMLMGLYLLVIATQDSQYRDNYQREAHTWMSSWTCTLIGIVAMTSSEVSVLILVFMSLERFLLIAVPFSGHQNMTMRTACKCLATIWIFGISISGIPVLYWWDSTRFYGTNGMCFPLHIDDPYLTGWQYSAFIFLGINLVGLILIAIIYTWMFVSIWKTRHATPISSVGDFEFVIRFFFIVLTDASCWAPIIGLKLVALSRVHIPGSLTSESGVKFKPILTADLYGWVVVFILPVNSAINPVLYTFTTTKFREQIFKCGWQMGSHRSLVTRRQSTADTECSRSSSNRNMVACSMMSRKKSSQSDIYTKLPIINGKIRANNGIHSTNLNSKDPVLT